MFRLCVKSWSFLAPTTAKQSIRFASSPKATPTVCSTEKIAVVLSGCGVFDGTEIHEAVHVLSHLTKNAALPIVFAPDIPTAEIIDHQTGNVVEEIRKVISESARIARGQVTPLSELVKPEVASALDAIIFPGGFGAAKNLSNFAKEGAECTVHPDVAAVLKYFHKNRKPIGLTCIAPVLAAKVLNNITVTLGQDSCESWPYRYAIKEVKKMGATVEYRGVNEVAYDRENEIFSTPAYMYGPAKYHEVADGIGQLISFMLINMRKGEKPKKGEKSKSK